MKKIMFVCTGNTCRSPMAEAILRAMLKEKGIAGVRVSSSGVSPVVGQPIAPNANAALEFLGYKPVKYRARQLQAGDVETQDLIVCMTESHKRYLGGGENITTIAAITGLHDVNDPYGDSADTYIKTAEYLKYACADILNIIEKALQAEAKEKELTAALKKRKAQEAKALKAVKAEKVLKTPKPVKPKTPKAQKEPKPPKPVKTVKPVKQEKTKIK